MARQKVTPVVRGIAQSWYEEIKKIRYIKELVVSFGIMSIVVCSFFAYRFYVVYREQSAQRVLAEYIAEYQKISDGQLDDWQRMEALFQLGSKQQSNSYLAPYFLLFQVDVLLRQDKKKEALAIMDTLVGRAENSPLLPLFKTKHALMKLDELDEATRKDGITELEGLINDKKNPFRDTAQFYLGSYYWANDSIAQAKKVWQILVNDQRQEKLAPSPWVDLVKNKLEQMAG